ncbi:MAG: hypothetical protein DMD35_03715 [Gemmatimonadetes bacterium]|nr:MAG: hypothetical protein DMD35_03715 [Gemmatimonadota bacterium]
MSASEVEATLAGQSADSTLARRARRALDVARAELSAAGTCDVVSATLGTIVLRPDQVETVHRVRALLRHDGGCLLADDVGMGKTFVALAVAREWAAPLVVAPASLRTTWELAARRAGVVCGFASHEALSRGRSIDQRCDGVVVDESHRFRPTSRRHAALAELTAHAPVLMLSATPLQNRARELAAQLALFLGEIAYLLEPAALTRWVVRSPSTTELPLPVVAPPRWLPIHTDDGEVLRAVLALPPPPRAADVGDGGVLLQLSLVRAWASCRAALEATVRRRQRTLAAIEQCHHEGRLPTRRELASWEAGGDVQLGFPTLLASCAVDEQRRATLTRAIERERAALDALLRTIRHAGDPDPMRVAAVSALRRAHGGESILAFSEWRSTVLAYWSALRGEPGVGMLTAREARIASGRVTRDELLARFAPRAQGARAPGAHERVTLLLATDLLSEGVNLQDASVVVHLDLPWNPARLAQRLGRIRRPGGARAVTSYLLAPPARASMLLQAESRLRTKLARAERTIGRSIAVLPTLPAPGVVPALDAFGQARLDDGPVSASAAELRGEIARRLARWRATVDTGDGSPDANDCGAIAAVHSETSGWIAVLDDGRLVAAHADGVRRNAPSEAPEAILRALELADGAPRLARNEELDEARRALDDWIVRDWTQRSSGLDVAATPVRRRVRRALDDLLVAVPRHRRASSLECAARVRRALTRPLPLGIERELLALAGDQAGDAEWVEAAAAVVARTPIRARDATSSARPRFRALILFGGGARE